MSQPASAAPSRKKTVISLLVLAALTGIIVLLFKDNWAEITAALSQLSAWQVLVVLVVSGLSLVLMVKGVLGVPIEGSIPLFMLGVALSLFATTSIGIFMGTIARSMPQLGLLVILVLLPLQMLSGGSTPRESMPQMVQDIMLTMPTTHFVSLAQAILYRGAGFEIVWPQFLTLMAIGGAFFTIALLRFRKTIGTMA